ncbi:MAG: hypothetical protein AAFX40_08170, partial [Cyanobacteria bacterium J06639_1]
SLLTLISGVIAGVMESSAHSTVSHHWHLNIRKDRFIVSEERFNILTSVFVKELHDIDRIDFSGKGNPFSDETVHAVSMIVTDANSSGTRIDLEASLRPSELEWLQNTINAKIQMLR